MKLGEIAKITIKKLFECACCHTHVDYESIGAVDTGITVCKECLPKVTSRYKNLKDTYLMVYKGQQPTEEELLEIKKMSLNIQFIRENIPCTLVASVE